VIDKGRLRWQEEQVELRARERMQGARPVPPPLATIDMPARQVLDAEHVDLLVSAVFRSRKGSEPHVVTILRGPQGLTVQCTTCKAALGLDTRPEGCHAAKAVRALIGAHT
jgi:hypothetical protein